MLRSLRLLWLMLVLAAWLIPVPAARADWNELIRPYRFFPETGHSLDNATFGSFWDRNGGLAVFGYPISRRFSEFTLDTGPQYPARVQWFERARFEGHGSAPRLGRLGVDRLHQLGIDWQTLPKASPSDPHYFPQTGQAISFEPFWQYWRTHGLELGDRGISERESLALFGYPISPARMETNSSGDTVLTQWFERARFEWHPNNPEPYKVLLGLLGLELTQTRRDTVPFLPEPDWTPPASDDPAVLFPYIRQRVLLAINEERMVTWNLPPVTERAELNGLADQLAREWTLVRWQRGGSDERALLEAWKARLGQLQPPAFPVYLTLNGMVPRSVEEIGCLNINPRDPLEDSGIFSKEHTGDARQFTIGIYGPYDTTCGRAVTLAYIASY